MCVVSMIIDHYKKEWPNPNDIPVNPIPPYQPEPFKPYQPYTQPFLFPPLTIEDVKKEIEKAREEDRKNGTPDCSGPDKLEWLKKFEERIDELEQELHDHETFGHPVRNPEKDKVT